MGTSREERLCALFPKLRASGFRITSPATPAYNCIAWAVGQDDVWWEPTPLGKEYWPPGCPREYSTETYIAALRAVGFEVCSDSMIESGFEKVALYAKSESEFHAARQLGSAVWTSKLGQLEDIEHGTLEGLVGLVYGKVICILKRSTSARESE